MNKPDYKHVLKGDNVSLLIFEGGFSELERQFCNNMMSGKEFTLKVEIHGAKGELLHFRNFSDTFARPPEKRKKV